MVSVLGSKFRGPTFWSTMVSHNMHLFPKGFKKNRNMNTRNKELETRSVRQRLGEGGNPQLILL